MPTKWLQERADGSKNGHGMLPRRAFCVCTPTEAVCEQDLESDHVHSTQESAGGTSPARPPLSDRLDAADPDQKVPCAFREMGTEI